MTNHELGRQLGVLIIEERQKTNQILKLINEAMSRRSYVELGFSSMFDWLVRGFGYSNAAAFRRIEAAKLLRTLPEISEKLESGKLNLSTLAKAQSFFKASACPITTSEKAKVITQLENQSVAQTEKIMMSLYPELASQVRTERTITIDKNTTRLR